MTQQPITEPDLGQLFQAGEIVPTDGEYEIVDGEGSLTDYDSIKLQQGEEFPTLMEPDLWYRLLECDEDE
jgi:hypothetical protein